MELPKLSSEAKVGLFVLLGILLLAYMSLRLGGIQIGRAEGYTLFVEFDSAAGLDPNAAVRVAGVEVGRVRKISLVDHKALLELQIRPDIKIGKDFTAVLTTKGLLGEKYLELLPGHPGAPPLKEGEYITRTRAYADIDRLITILSDVSLDIKKITESLSNVLGGDAGEQTISNIVKNIEELTFRLNRIVAKNDDQFENIMRNLDSFTAFLNNEGPQVTTELRTAIKNLSESLLATSENLDGMITENRGNLKDGVENLKAASLSLQQAMDTLNKVAGELGPDISTTMSSVKNIAQKIDQGQGTLGQLVNDKTLHENINKTVSGINSYIERAESFQTFIGFRGEYLFDARDTKSYLTLRIQPKADKYYLLEVVDDPRGKITEETREIVTNGVPSTITETKTTDQIKISAQIAKRFDNFVVRGGIIESTGGAGLDYYMFRDRLKLTLEAFDFSRDGGAHLKAGSTLYLNKFFFLTAGYDDFTNNVGLRSAYVGLGFQFRDEDLKFLLSSAPPVSF
ncbi:MAG: MCE family protein [Deltaproteobacteria bacterium]|nr:MCE family protein [Deltaproteobacteria bacterium]MBZ0220669.1 MCE family protein [Deltaproteobacteria bacterium]